MSGEESGDPSGCREQGRERAQRMTKGQRRERRRSAVLGEVAPVQCGRRAEGKGESSEQTRAHGSTVLFGNGRYASAASAATPTRGRSRRCSYTTKRRCQSGENLRLKRSRLSS